MKKINIMLIGCGPHSQRIYYPIIESIKTKYNAFIKVVVDLDTKEKNVTEYLVNKKYNPCSKVFLNSNFLKLRNGIESNFLPILNKEVEKHKINTVIIATEPIVHLNYAKWAIGKGLNVLMDKPINTRENVSTDIKQAKALISDFENLLSEYLTNKKEHKNIFHLLAQRRSHPAFKYIIDKIKEVSKVTNCPITSTQSFHGDGQWRLPSEIIDINYHPYNQGYGKCSHSGYHTIDTISYILEKTKIENKEINNAEIYSKFLRPNDFLTQLNQKDYLKLFKDYKNFQKYSDEEFVEKTKNYGEIDAFVNVAFKKDDKVITLSSINMIHNCFSHRFLLDASKVDLYKGNGRIRHENHYIAQGPFQSILFSSFQSDEVDLSLKPENEYDFGGEYHLDICVFRNSSLFPGWKTLEKKSVRDLSERFVDGLSRGHQEDARRACIIDFFKAITNSNFKSDNDMSKHCIGTKLLSAIYQSACNDFNKKKPIIKIKI